MEVIDLAIKALIALVALGTMSNINRLIDAKIKLAEIKSSELTTRRNMWKAWTKVAHEMVRNKSWTGFKE